MESTFKFLEYRLNTSNLTLKFFCAFRTQKENQKQMDAQDEQNLLRGQKNYLEVEVRKFRRKKLLSYHIFEQELLREVSGVVLR